MKEFIRSLKTIVLASIIMGVHPTLAAAQPCAPDGDVDLNGIITPADARLALEHFLRIATPPLTACQQAHANVVNPSERIITPADALCIFQKFLAGTTYYILSDFAPGR